MKKAIVVKRINRAVFSLGHLSFQYAVNMAERVTGAKLAGVADLIQRSA